MRKERETFGESQEWKTRTDFIGNDLKNKHLNVLKYILHF